MGGRALTHASEARHDDWSTDQDFGAHYKARLSHLVGFFRAKGISHDEAADLAHETVLRTLVHLKRHGRTKEDIGPLTRTIARNLLIERVRRAAPAVVSLDGEIDAADDAPDPSELALQSERREAVQAAMAALTPRHRRVIELWMQGRSPAEIARELGIKRNAADAILHRARRTLASRLGPRALWGGVVLAWVRVRTQTRSAAHSLASWSPDSQILAPAGVSLATVGIAAVLSLTGPVADAPSLPTDIGDATPTASTGPPRAAVKDSVAKVTRTATDVAETAADVPEYAVRNVGPAIDNPATVGKEEGLLDLSYDPDKHGAGALDNLLEPAFQSCALSGACETAAPR